VEAKLCLAPEGHTFISTTIPAVILESPSTHPDLCSSGNLGPNDTSSVSTSSPGASLGPELLDPLCQLPADGEDDLRAPLGARTPDSKPELEARDPSAARALESTVEEQEGEGQVVEEEECPICAEPYGPSEHHLTLLNCGHSLCVGCLHQLLGMTPRADLGRVCCPLCRQKTPMLEWEICQLQEELLRADGPQRPMRTASVTALHPGPWPWGPLEHRYQLRFLAGPVGGRSCLPFLPCPPSLGTWLWALRERGPCARRLSLLSLLVLELLGLVVIFMPLLLLGVLFMLLDRSTH
jgi:hypothetical protein